MLTLYKARVVDLVHLTSTGVGRGNLTNMIDDPNVKPWFLMALQYIEISSSYYCDNCRILTKDGVSFYSCGFDECLILPFDLGRLVPPGVETSEKIQRFDYESQRMVQEVIRQYVERLCTV